MFRVGEDDEPETPAVVAARLKVSTRTLANWRIQGAGPRFIKLGDGPKAPVRYMRADTDAWLAQRPAGSGAAA